MLTVIQVRLHARIGCARYEIEIGMHGTGVNSPGSGLWFCLS